MNERLDQFASIQFVVIIGIMHLKVMELQFLLRHLARVDRNVHMFGDMPACRKREDKTRSS